MSMCKVCHKDSQKHSERLWLLHQQRLKCAYCGRTSDKHSEDLSDIHQEVIPKNKKLAVKALGTGPKTLGYIQEWNTLDGSTYQKEFVPIFISCSGCEKSMGLEESEVADVTGKMCLECFCNVTDQHHSWHSKPWWQVNGGKYAVSD